LAAFARVCAVDGAQDAHPTALNHDFVSFERVKIFDFRYLSIG